MQIKEKKIENKLKFFIKIYEQEFMVARAKLTTMNKIIFYITKTSAFLCLPRSMNREEWRGRAGD